MAHTHLKSNNACGYDLHSRGRGINLPRKKKKKKKKKGEKGLGGTKGGTLSGV